MVLFSSFRQKRKSNPFDLRKKISIYQNETPGFGHERRETKITELENTLTAVS